MNVKSFLKDKDFSVPSEKLQEINERARKFVAALESAKKKAKVKADIYVGGSFAKGTLIRSDEYDIDIFVRFSDLKEKDLSEQLEKLLKEKEVKMWKNEKIHGSRDYFRIIVGKDVTFELIPVRKIKSPREMENVTDLSYFHVNYVSRKLRKDRKLVREISLAKRFCKAAGVYGAESYIQGFSGYGLECLVIHYRTFERMLRELAKAKEQIILDPEKFYRNKELIRIEINEAKLQSPIVLIDPTWKSRNVLAALNAESFARFQKAAREFLKKPSLDFFEVRKNVKEELKKYAKKMNCEFVYVRLETDKQEGDIAGTKMKKFANLLVDEISVYFDALRKEFEYFGGKEGELYLIAKPKKEVLKRGPPTKLKEHASAFRKSHKGVFEKGGWLFAREKVNFTIRKFVNDYAKKQKDKLKEMDIVRLEGY